MAAIEEKVRKHFILQQEVMREAGYSGIGEHTEDHRLLAAEYHRVVERLGGTTGVLLRPEVIALLNSLEKHLEVEDRLLEQHLNSVAPGRPFAPAFELHGGVEVLRLDYSNIKAPHLPRAFRVAASTIATAAPRSLRILTILDSCFDAPAGDAFKEYVAGNGPYVFRSAVVASSFWRVLVTGLKLRTRPDLALFGDERSALEWLVT